MAGLAAGLAALPSISDGDEVLVLACDLPRVAEIVATLDAAEPGTDEVCLVDAENYIRSFWRLATGDLRCRPHWRATCTTARWAAPWAACG